MAEMNMDELSRFDPRVSVAAAWGCTEPVSLPPLRQPCLVVIQEESDEGPPAADVFLFVAYRRLKNATWGSRYEIPEAYSPLEDVFMQVPVATIVRGGQFYAVPGGAEILQALASVMDIGPFLTDYYGPDRHAAVLLHLVKAAGRALPEELISSLQRVFPTEQIDAAWLEAMVRRLQEEGYGIWKAKENFYYVSAQPGSLELYYNRKQKAAERLLATYVPPYVLAVRSCLAGWLRRLVREELQNILGKEHENGQQRGAAREAGTPAEGREG